MVEVLNAATPAGQRCANLLPLNQLQPGSGVGRGGGNVIYLHGTQAYVDNAKRFITQLDLPLPGMELQLTGVQISARKEKGRQRQADALVKTRWIIANTKQVLSESLAAAQGFSGITALAGEQCSNSELSRALRDRCKIDLDFKNTIEELGFGRTIDPEVGESTLEIFLIGNSLKPEASVDFYRTMYSYLVDGGIHKDGKLEAAQGEVDRDGVFKARDKRFQPYFNALRDDLGRPPYERFFRSRGLESACTFPKPEDDLKEGERCQQWEWLARCIPIRDLSRTEDRVQTELAKKAIREAADKGISRYESCDISGSASGSKEGISLASIITGYERGIVLEFAHQYSDFVLNPSRFDPDELQRTADNLNTLIQDVTEFLQEDLQDLFVDPTVAQIKKAVSEQKGVEFAQAGRTTLSTLDGVESTIGTTSTSGFQIPTPTEDLAELLTRAQEVQEAFDGIVPAEVSAAATGGIPISNLVGLATAFSEDRSTPIEIQTGTSLTFTPGISRNLDAAELNINLVISDPSITATQQDANVPPISRIGRQEIQTTVYTQALDFFELSGFTNQATIGVRRKPLPVVGTLWNIVFGGIPGFRDLFSIGPKTQNVNHESLILTTAFITPTPLSFGAFYSPPEDLLSARVREARMHVDEARKHLEEAESELFRVIANGEDREQADMRLGTARENLHDLQTANSSAFARQRDLGFCRNQLELDRYLASPEEEDSSSGSDNRGGVRTFSEPSFPAGTRITAERCSGFEVRELKPNESQ